VGVFFSPPLLFFSMDFLDLFARDGCGGRAAGPTTHHATICLGDGREARSLVTNLSYDGCQLVTEAVLSVGETLVLILPGRGSIDAQVRWIADERAGVRFLTGTSPSEQRRARIGV
jgi:hypothetical protein